MKKEMVKLNRIKIAHSEEEAQRLISEGYIPVNSKPTAKGADNSGQKADPAQGKSGADGGQAADPAQGQNGADGSQKAGKGVGKK